MKLEMRPARSDSLECFDCLIHHAERMFEVARKGIRLKLLKVLKSAVVYELPVLVSESLQKVGSAEPSRRCQSVGQKDDYSSCQSKPRCFLVIGRIALRSRIHIVRRCS